MPEMPSSEFILETITGLPEGSVPKSSEFVNPENSTAPSAIEESTILVEEIAQIEVTDTSDVSDDADLPLENTFADDSIVSNPNNGAVFMPIWEYANAWTERIAIRLGLRMY